MISVNEEYKNVLKSDEQQYDAYIILEDGTKVDTDISGLKPIYNLGEKIIGNFATKRVEFTLFNTGKYNITNKEFEAFIGLKVNNEFKYTSIGKYIADKPVLKDEATDENTIKARDYSLKFKVAYEPILTFPCSVKKAISDICGYLNIDYIENNFINGDYILQEFYIDEEATFFDVIKILVEAGFANAFITNTNKLIVKSPSMTVNYKFDLNELFELKKEDNKFGKLNSVVASRIVADDGSTTEDVYAKDENSITTNGLYEYKIIQNDAIDYDRQTAVNNMLTGILNFEYNPAKLETVYNPALEVGDMLEVPDKKTDTSFLLFAKEICADLSNGLMTIESTEKTKTETDYKSATNKDKRRKTEIKVNKLEGEITQRIESVETTADEALDNTDILDEFIEQKEVQIEAAESTLQNVQLFGESVQKTREGYNKFPYTTNTYSSSGITVTRNEDGTYTFNGTTFSLEGEIGLKVFSKTDFEEEVKFENGKTYKLTVKEFSGSKTGGSITVAVKKDTGEMVYNYINQGSPIITATYDAILEFANLYVGSANVTFNNYKIGVMITEGSDDKEFEQYGAMPSIDYPSSVNSIKNIDYKITGKNAIYDTFSKTKGFITYKVAKENITQNMLFSGIIDSNVKATVYFSVDDKIVSAGEINIIENTKFSKVINVTNEILGLVKNSQNIFLQIYNNQVDFSNFNDKEIMLEHGTVLTDYEPYKEVKTTIALPENVELCSLPNGVEDYTDSTGVIHKKIGKMVLGTQNWSVYQSEGNADRYYCFTSDVDSLIKEYSTQNTYNFCNIAQSVEMLLTSTVVDKDSFCIGYQGTARLRFMLKKDVIDAQEGDTLSAKLNNLFISKNAYILAENIEEATQNLAETEKTKLQNLETFEGINNITTNATLSAEYFRNIDLNKAFETKTSATNKYTEIKSTTDTIKNTVAETNSYVDNAVMSKIVATEQSIEGLKISLQQTGGQNLIKNSTLKFGLSKNVTTTGTVTVEEYTEIQNNTVSKSAIKINAGNVIYEPCDVKEGNVYTFSCLVNKLELANASITITNVLDNKIDVVAEAEKFVEIGYTFVALSSKVQIKLESDTNYTLFSDCMLSAGAERKAWQLASGEISNKGVNINDDGAEFFNSDVNTKLTISSTGTNIINTETGEVRAKFNADDTLVNNLTVEGISRHGRLIHTDFGTHITTSWNNN